MRKRWHTPLFDDLNKYWEEIAEARSTEEEVDLVESTVKTDGLILDLCCGTGRHSILLADRGLKMIGFDISPNLLKIAKQKISEKKACVSLVRGEMQHLPFRAQVFASIISMFTSFGYLLSKKEDIKSLKEVERTLQGNGHFLLDVVNRGHLLKAFRKKDWGEYSSFYMLERRVLDEENSVLHSKWIFVNKETGDTESFEHTLRLYRPSKLRKMLEKTGFFVKEIFGGYNKEVFKEDSSRLVLLAIKSGTYIEK